MADKPLAASLTGRRLWKYPHINKAALVGAPAHKGVTPGQAVGAGVLPVLCLVPGSLMVADLLNSDSYDTLAGAIGIGGIYRRKDTGEQCDDCRDNDGQQQERDQDQ